VDAALEAFADRIRAGEDVESSRITGRDLSRR
jgi:hypothetical protein